MSLSAILFRVCSCCISVVVQQLGLRWLWLKGVVWGSPCIAGWVNISLETSENLGELPVSGKGKGTCFVLPGTGSVTWPSPLPGCGSELTVFVSEACCEPLREAAVHCCGRKATSFSPHHRLRIQESDPAACFSLTVTSSARQVTLWSLWRYNGNQLSIFKVCGRHNRKNDKSNQHRGLRFKLPSTTPSLIWELTEVMAVPLFIQLATTMSEKAVTCGLSTWSPAPNWKTFQA